MLNQDMSKTTIIKIERIQSLKHWDIYKNEITRLSELNNGTLPAQKTLYHGTGVTLPSQIYDSEEGFDMRWGKPGNWGIGLYFADESSYSHEYCYKIPPANVIFQMF